MAEIGCPRLVAPVVVAAGRFAGEELPNGAARGTDDRHRGRLAHSRGRSLPPIRFVIRLLLASFSFSFEDPPVPSTITN